MSLKDEHPVEYRAWKAMRWRCNPKSPTKNRYYDRGIGVCERWDSFANFFEDMGERPSKDYSVDRIDNNEGYEPSNVKWSTRIEQTNNTGRTNKITYDGQDITLMHIVRTIGIHPETVRNRMKKGWSYERIIAKPLNASIRQRSNDGKFI